MTDNEQKDRHIADGKAIEVEEEKDVSFKDIGIILVVHIATALVIVIIIRITQ